MSFVNQYSDARISGTCTYLNTQNVVTNYSGDCQLYVAPDSAVLSTITPITVTVVNGAWSHDVYVAVAGQWYYEIRSINPIHGASGAGRFAVRESPFPGPTP